MWSLKEAYQNNRGFALIEVILSICLISLILCSAFTILNYSMNSFKDSSEIDDILLNGRYAIEYVKDEVLSADRIINSSKFKNLNFEYPDNIGFVIMSKSNSKINYTTYYKKNDELIRISCEGIEGVYPASSRFSGYNQICTMLLNIGKINLGIDDKLIKLHFRLGDGYDNAADFRSTIFIRCPIDY